MLGKASSSAQQSQPSGKVYLQKDPTQSAFRMLLDMLDDTQLVDLENDLDFYARSGLMSEKLGQILSDAHQAYRQVA